MFVDLEYVSRNLEIDTKSLMLFAKKGLICPKRDESGRLILDESELGRLSFILSLKNDWGYSLSKVEEMMQSNPHATKSPSRHSSLSA